jgi:transcriptional regulator with XRE-family HTH domain
MAWKEMNINELAKSLGVNASEVREKQKIIQLIVKARKEQKLSQAAMAKKMGLTQGRIAQIESGVGTSKITFDILLNILVALGFDFKILPKKAA